ncbi:DUF262 domain-containing protein [Corynebacterium suedekumii]|uniref:DUF262 domain-containing protein n=1 Tax=Corynebacterium suedekumii TaxID=3049801 RepID=A0ABY8VMX6_9CORY|nr:DUF262 domain-containing protein [Corynebacterium suedekumii]WIM70447.1 DUF262 domain-containing protein [Corynebacterium suedekumii]
MQAEQRTWRKQADGEHPMVKADEAILRKVLEGENQYMVPLYQRPYQWDTEQWQTLWDDVVELVKDRRDNPKTNHFIGWVWCRNW